MKIGYLGSGSWGFCLASLLGSLGHDVMLWTARPEYAELLAKKREHPKMPHFKADARVEFTSDLRRTLEGADMLVESVTSMGIRPVCEEILAAGGVTCPFILTSKGIEQNSGLLLPEIVLQVFGESYRSKIGYLSGPSHAEEVIRKLPTSVVCSSYEPELMLQVRDLFQAPYFRVYPNADIAGVAFGGAMKNVIAIACGIADGLGFGDNTQAALMTRGLHEMRKLSVAKGCNPETLNGLSGLGDLCVTCLSKWSRNRRFGHLLTEGLTPQSAREKIGMVVEGAYACISALQLGRKAHIPTPITEAVHAVIYEGLAPRDAVNALLQRAIKEEHL